MAVVEHAVKLGFTGIGVAKSFVHVNYTRIVVLLIG
jgi:hypothetical protein